MRTCGEYELDMNDNVQMTCDIEHGVVSFVFDDDAKGCDVMTVHNSDIENKLLPMNNCFVTTSMVLLAMNRVMMTMDMIMSMSMGSNNEHEMMTSST